MGEVFPSPNHPLFYFLIKKNQKEGDGGRFFVPHKSFLGSDRYDFEPADLIVLFFRKLAFCCGIEFLKWFC